MAEPKDGLPPQILELVLKGIVEGSIQSDQVSEWLQDEFDRAPEQFDDTNSNVNQLLDKLQNSKSGKALLWTKKLFDTLPNTITQGMNFANRIKDIKDSKAMIDKAAEAEAKLKKPAFTKPTADTTAVDRAIEGAEQDASVAGGGAVRSLRDQIRENYRTDIESAKNVSTGQAANVQANAQVAQVRRNRQLRDIPLIEQRLRGDALSRKDKLIGTRAGIQTANDRIRAASDPLRESRYQAERDRIDQLGSEGRESLRNSRYNLAGTTGQLLGNIGGLVNTGIQAFGNFDGGQQGGSGQYATPNTAGAKRMQADVMDHFGYNKPYEWSQSPAYGQGADTDLKQYQGSLSSNPYINQKDIPYLGGV